jgi:6-phosphogluconolactonase/glucosamine-6-phosphate isomerase/deaminase
VTDLLAATLVANQSTLLQVTEVLKQASTMGIADIQKAQQMTVLATGFAKATAVHRALLLMRRYSHLKRDIDRQ